MSWKNARAAEDAAIVEAYLNGEGANYFVDDPQYTAEFGPLTEFFVGVARMEEDKSRKAVYRGQSVTRAWRLRSSMKPATLLHETDQWRRP